MEITKWINVGKVDAGKDPDLQHYFYDAGISEQIIKNKLGFLLLGRKGAGKTATYRFLEGKPKQLFGTQDVIVSLSFTSYSWRAHDLFRDETQASSSAHRDSWRLVIAIEATRKLAEHIRATGRAIPAELKHSEECLHRIFTDPVPVWTELIKDKIFALTKIDLPEGKGEISGAEVGVSGGGIAFDVVKDDPKLRAALSRNGERLTSILEANLKKSLGKDRVFMLFDGLDEGWIATDYSICKPIIAGLITAANHVVKEFDGRVRPIVFLREDIFHVLDLNDKNKLLEDCGAALKWERDSLITMLLSRINYFARKYGEPEKTDVEELFDRKEMHQRAAPIKYILGRTFYRPRDVIAYFSRIIEDDRSNPAEKERRQLTVDAIYNTEHSYSEYLLNEYQDEWKTQQPQIIDYFDAITNLTKTSIVPDDYEAELKKKITGLDKAGFRRILQFMFDTSVLGFKVGKSTEWRFKCFNPTQGFTDVAEYRLHRGLQKGLGVKGIGKADAKPEDDD